MTQKWVAGRDNDSDEKEGHVRPLRDDRSIDAPEGVWVDVPRGMVAAEGTYVDENGVLRMVGSGNLAIWHHRCKAVHTVSCDWTTDDPSELNTTYAPGAPWCPICVDKMKLDEIRKEQEAEEEEYKDRLKGMFGA